MKGIALVGDHNSGKTTLGLKIVEILKKRGYHPFVIKHAPHTKSFADEGKDTERYLSVTGSVLLQGDGVYGLFVKDHMPLHKIFSLMRDVGANFLLYEGTPHGLLIPWLKVGSGKGDSPYTLWHVENPSQMTDEDIDKLVDEILEKAWTIPMMLNCGKCGVDTCQEYVKDILKGVDRKCVLWDSRLRIIVDGREIPLVPFIEKLYDSVIRSLINNLKGVSSGYHSVNIYMRGEQDED